MLEIKDLTVSVDTENILNDFNLTINSGEIHALMGPNGAGKSTICKVILGSNDYKIENGLIKFEGKILNNLTTSERAKLGIFLLNQNPIAIEGVTNAEMLRMAISEKTGEHVSIYEFNKKIEAICESLNLDKSFIHREINVGASGGERKKIELMHLWMLEPKVILLDEIDSGLDVDALKIVTESLMKYYKEYRPTIIIITHQIKILDYLIPEFVHIVKNGTIVETGSSSLAKKIENSGFNETNTIGDKINHE